MTRSRSAFTRSFLVFLGALVAGAWIRAEVAIQLVTVDNPGNAQDPATGFGAVATVFVMGVEEVTNRQYADFLNAVASASDPHGLFNVTMDVDLRGGISRTLQGGIQVYDTRPNMADKPVNFVSWLDAARFVNWIQNGQPIGSQTAGVTETGAYDLTVPNAGIAAVRQPGARYFLPSEDEWYKAAYHEPGIAYWLYPTRSNMEPTLANADAQGNIANPGANVANYNNGAMWNGSGLGNVTTVQSAGPASESFYGTRDQGGNLAEWTEAIMGANQRVIRGGTWDSTPVDLRATGRRGQTSGSETSEIGFRIASSLRKRVHFSISPATGGVPAPPPNAVFNSPDEADIYSSDVQLFRPAGNRGNDLRVNEPDLGLVVGDDIDALTKRRELPSTYSYVLDFIFSVTPGSRGAPGTAVAAEFPTNAADLFQVDSASLTGNLLAIAETDLGLDGADPNEDIDALSLEPDNPFSAGERVYFSLRRGSPTLAANGWSPADILTVRVGMPGTLQVAVQAADLGLSPQTDNIDALVLLEGGDLNGDGDFYDGGEARPIVYFSVDLASIGVGGTDVSSERVANGGNGHAADVYYSQASGNHFVTLDGVNDAGLLPGDDLDALERPEVQCDNPYPFVPLRPVPPQPPKPSIGGRTEKAPLCIDVGICDQSAFPQKWSATIRVTTVDANGVRRTEPESIICGMGGTKADAMKELLGKVKCPSDRDKKLFQGPVAINNPADFPPCFQGHPTIIAVVRAKIDPCCAQEVWICANALGLSGWTAGFKVQPGPCDRILVVAGMQGPPSVPGTYEIAFGNSDPENPVELRYSRPFARGEDPVAILEDVARQIRNDGGIAGVDPMDPPTLLVGGTPIDADESGPAVLEAGSPDSDAETFTTTGMTLTVPVDCNRNKIPDVLDVASRSSNDIDGDGIPDECGLRLFARGDANNDDIVDVSDAVRTFDYLFLGTAPIGCLDAADANDSGTLDVSDAVYLLNFLFFGDEAPNFPTHPFCGVDPTDDALGCTRSRCADYVACPEAMSCALNGAGSMINVRWTAGSGLERLELLKDGTVVQALAPTANQAVVTLQPADAGRMVALRLRASGPGVTCADLTCSVNVPQGAVCPQNLTCTLDAATGTITARWQAGQRLTSLQLLKDGSVVQNPAPGATQAVVALVPADFGRTVALRLRASGPGATCVDLTCNVAVPQAAVCPQSLTCALDTAAGTITARWQAGQRLTSLQLLKDGAVVQNLAPGATQAVVALVPADFGRTVALRLRASGPGATCVDLTCNVAVPQGAVCPRNLTCTLDAAAGTITARWQAGQSLTTLQLLNDGAVVQNLAPGATQAVVTLVPADFGRTVALRLRAAGPGVTCTDLTCNVAVPQAAVCPQSLTCTLDAAAGTITVRWQAGQRLTSLQLLKDGAVVQNLAVTASQAVVTLQPADAGRTVALRLRAAGPGVTCTDLTCSVPVPQAAVCPRNLTCTLDVLEELISVSWQAGQRLTTLQLLKDGVVVQNLAVGASQAVVVLQPADFGRTVAFRLRATGPGVTCTDLTCNVTVPRRFIRGDCQPNGVLETADLVAILTFIQNGTPVPCQKACDADDSGMLTTADGIFLNNRLFMNGPPPPPPFPNCGLDPTPDNLTCSSFPPCDG